MRRREFVAGLVGTAAWPAVVRAQQPAMPVIGFLRSTSIESARHLVIAFREGLKAAGYIEGENVSVEYHSAEGQPDRLRALVSDLVQQSVSVIVANSITAIEAKDITKTVPIVFVGGGDPVKQRLIVSLNRPGGNVTGVSFFGGCWGRSDWNCCGNWCLRRQRLPPW